MRCLVINLLSRANWATVWRQPNRPRYRYYSPLTTLIPLQHRSHRIPTLACGLCGHILIRHDGILVIPYIFLTLHRTRLKFQFHGACYFEWMPIIRKVADAKSICICYQINGMYQLHLRNIQ